MLYNATTVEDTTSITRYERAHRIELSYPLNGVPQIMFVTSWVELDNETGVETQKESYRNVSDVVDDPSESFSVYDETGAEVATATYGEVAGLLYNLFFHVVAKTDA
tara:strand:+ start:514 stop:834 length:321 start_codon:yes stop_codon:yes gene_type:complete